MASNQDIPEEAFEIHNQMVDYLGEQINDDHLCRLKALFNNIPLTANDNKKIHDISGLFNRLMEKEKIGIGNYTKMISNLRQINPKLATYVEKKEIEIKKIINGDPAAMIVTTADTGQAKKIHPDLEPMIDTAKARIKKEKEEKKFYPTKGFCDAKDKLQKNRVVVIKGNTGDGKTAIAVRLLHWLSEEQQAGQPLQIHKFKKLDLLAPNLKLITFIDDIFGEKDVCKKDVQEWNKRISDVETLFVDKQTQPNFLIITIRNEVFNSLEKRSLGAILTKDNIIDLSSQTYILAEEKNELLELYKPKNLSWTDQEKNQISNYAPNIGFPQCCQLFYNSEEMQKEGVKFFENPFHFLNEALSRLQECSALLCLFLNNGMLRVKDLDPNSKKVDEKLLEEAFEINLIDAEDDSTKLTYKKKVEFVKESLDKLLGFLVVKQKHRWLEECALYLLGEGVEPDKETVFSVVERGSVKVLRKLLQYDVTPTARDSINRNVLHRACLYTYEREEMVMLLCDTYPHLVHDSAGGQTPLNVVAGTGNRFMFQPVERCVLNTLNRVEDQQHKCESVDGRVVHRNCVCAQYMAQFVDVSGRTVLHYSCVMGNSEVCLYLCQSYPALTTAVDNDGRTVLHYSCVMGNSEVCLYLCQSYPALTTAVSKDGRHCLHYLARSMLSDVDMFAECETRVKQYLESTGRKYDITTILDNNGKSVLDKAKEGAEERAKEWGTENNRLMGKGIQRPNRTIGLSRSTRTKGPSEKDQPG
ncbi:hypothetical protein KP79_PYT06757 [Mizuhopecten yessoensis]|uniref:Novel STAND NTPase 3 domain-containing protein n=1 Tax=Mizuhopecten yessoensis TaxID=6573 RepID=A0A210QND9_MIZYE|nr:hypothetical protein KP79_PYT06757 [Mizuhopecten yessoensis]